MKNIFFNNLSTLYFEHIWIRVYRINQDAKMVGKYCSGTKLSFYIFLKLLKWFHAATDALRIIATTLTTIATTTTVIASTTETPI
jgi:hypothetical protein